MDLVEVKSSFIASVGYEAGVLRIVFKDGKQRDYRATESDYADLLAAPSKGKWLHQWLSPGAPSVATSGDARSPLATHEDDPCCAKRLSKELRDRKLDGREQWICPKCGMEWLAKMIEGFKHWAPHCPVMRF